MVGPLSRMVCAPSCSARRSVWMTLSRVSAGSRSWAGRLDVGRDPLGAELIGHALGRAHQPCGQGAGADAHENALDRGPDPIDRVLAPVDAHLRVHALGGAAQGQLAQGDEVALAEEVRQRLLGLAGEIDLALAEALQEIVGRQIDQLDLVGLLEDRVRHGLPHDDAGDLGHHVVQALDVLDVDGGVDVDAGVEQLDHVLPALGVAGAGRVGVGELVDQDDGRPPAEGAVEVELGQRGAAILERLPRKDLQPGQERVGLGPPVGLDVARRPRRRRRRAARARPPASRTSFPTPAAAPKNTFSLPRRARASSSLTRARSASGSGRYSLMSASAHSTRRVRARTRVM